MPVTVNCIVKGETELNILDEEFLYLFTRLGLRFCWRVDIYETSANLVSSWV